VRITIAKGVPASIIALLGGLVATLSVGDAASAEKPTVKLTSRPDRIVLTSGRLELVIKTSFPSNPCSLRDLKSGRVYADGDYSWPQCVHPRDGMYVTMEEDDGTCLVEWTQGRIDALDVGQTFSASPAEPDVITEQITLRNPTDKPMRVPSFICGFTKKIHDGENWLPGVADSHFCDIPYRRHPETGELCDWTVPQLVARKNWFSVDRMHSRQETPIYGAEGWAWVEEGSGVGGQGAGARGQSAVGSGQWAVGSPPPSANPQSPIPNPLSDRTYSDRLQKGKGATSLLIAKYNPDAMEWSLLETMTKSTKTGTEKLLRFGGAGQWKLGAPEGAGCLPPGASFSFGQTRYQVLDGDWRAAYAAFRRFTESKGHRLPPKFDPPVHWNELYDNPLWAVAGDTIENRKKVYRRKNMEVEAGKGRELGCQCLYLDPGWDTIFGSNIWAADRLGSEESFVAWLKEKYGFPMALHTPLAPWSDPAGYPPEACRMDKAGHRLGELCVASRLYIDTKVARLKELCKHGAYFLMYDGSWFPGECWDKSHGHSLPVTHQEHVDAILKIEQELHKAYPNALIEQHDPMTGPGSVRYTPTYFMHAKPGAFDELWGYEYMNECMGDVLSRRACSLYYVNLAYSIPIYLHFDLRKENRQAMMFWWYASTCRHLGVGGKPTDPAVWTALKSAMKTYLGLKRFYSQGVFYGLDETMHCHTLPDRRQCVINCFNLDEKPARRTVRFRLGEIGLPSGSVQVEGAPFRQDGDEMALDLAILPRGHLLLKVRPSP
jgi:hypothetical protein